MVTRMKLSLLQFASALPLKTARRTALPTAWSRLTLYRPSAGATPALARLTAPPTAARGQQNRLLQLRNRIRTTRACGRATAAYLSPRAYCRGHVELRPVTEKRT